MNESASVAGGYSRGGPCRYKAPRFLAALNESDQLSLSQFTMDTCFLDDIAQAVRHAADHGGAVQLTVGLPNG